MACSVCLRGRTQMFMCVRMHLQNRNCFIHEMVRHQTCYVQAVFIQYTAHNFNLGMYMHTRLLLCVLQVTDYMFDMKCRREEGRPCSVSFLGMLLPVAFKQFPFARSAAATHNRFCRKTNIPVSTYIHT